ncbi:TRADD-N-associated membrane domain-containing protein [Aeromonas dhakensis]|uniref:TRADD-N-associated membrane domain-containing protein n=1 Tax=Aeromonas dhakensis TaxID=196024 RepID=UPI0039878B01
MSQDVKDQEDISVLKEKKKYYEERIAKFRLSSLAIMSLVVFSAMGGIAYAFYSIGDLSVKTGVEIVQHFIPITFAAIGMTVFTAAYLAFFMSVSLRQRLRDVDFQLAKHGAEELQESIEEDFFNKLVKINFKYLDQYYLQTQEQADKSFRLTLFACFIGLAIIVTGIVMMFLDKTEPAYVTTAAGILSEFIAAVFFYLYNKTVQKMSQYHHKLVITQNISLALKISQELPDTEKSAAQNKLIDKLTENVNSLLAKSE